jgi:hypothetical protein
MPVIPLKKCIIPKKVKYHDLNLFDGKEIILRFLTTRDKIRIRLRDGNSNKCIDKSLSVPLEI